MNILDQSISILDVLSLVTKKQQIKSMELYASLTLYIKIMEPYVRPDTLIYYQENMDLVFKFFRLNDITETKQINQNIIDKFIKWSFANNNKAATINKRIGILQTMLRRLEEANAINAPVFKYTKLKETKTKIEPVKKEDVKKILSQIDKMSISHQLMLYLLIATGIRRNELVHIKIENINFKSHSIYLDFTKSGKPRYCYFDEKIEFLIRKQMENIKTTTNPYLFALGSGHVDKQSVSSMLYKLKHDLGIDVLSSHKLRHFYATELLKNGADIYTVKELLGHSDLEMTQRYLDFTNEEIKENNFKYNPIKNL